MTPRPQASKPYLVHDPCGRGLVRGAQRDEAVDPSGAEAVQVDAAQPAASLRGRGCIRFTERP
jgi:hypothetical protein